MGPAEVSILVVDDDVDTCYNLADILTDCGYRVDYAHEGTTALGLVQRRTYDIAILDLRMPGMDGLTLLREIRRIYDGTVEILITGLANGRLMADEVRAAGIPRVLLKPIDVPMLLRWIDEAMDRPRAFGTTRSGNNRRPALIGDWM